MKASNYCLKRPLRLPLKVNTLNSFWLPQTGFSSRTHRQHLEVLSLERFEQIGDPAFQSAVDEHPVAEVVEQDGPQSVHVTWPGTTHGKRAAFI